MNDFTKEQLQRLWHAMLSEDIEFGSKDDNLLKKIQYMIDNYRSEDDYRKDREFIKQTELDLFFSEDYLNKNIYHIFDNARVINCLKSMNLLTVGDLLQKTAIDIARHPGIGKKTFMEIKDTLNYYGIELKDGNIKISW